MKEDEDEEEKRRGGSRGRQSSDADPVTRRDPVKCVDHGVNCTHTLHSSLFTLLFLFQTVSLQLEYASLLKVPILTCLTAYSTTISS